MDSWESASVSVDTQTIWACQSSALDHYERHPTSSNIQENVFESSLGNIGKASYSKEEPRDPWNYFPSDDERSEKLIDANTPTHSALGSLDEEEDDEDAPKFFLLLKKIEGKKIKVKVFEGDSPTDRPVFSLEEKPTNMKKGTLVRPLDETYDKKKIIVHLEKSKGTFTPIASRDKRDAYGFASDHDLLKLEMEDVRVLRPIEIEKRFTLHHDFARFIFVRYLKRGDAIEFKEEGSEEMRRGYISSVDGDYRGDYVYSVRMPRGQGLPPPRLGREGHRGDRIRFYDDYEGNEHEGNMVFQVSADRIFAPSRRVEGNLERLPMRPGSPPLPREKLIPVRVLDSPPAYEFVNKSEAEDYSQGSSNSLINEFDRYSVESQKLPPKKQTPIKSESPREKLIPITVLERPSLPEDNRGVVHFRNLSSEFESRALVGNGPPPTKPRTKFDFAPTRPNLPPFGLTRNHSTGRNPSIEQPRTNGTANYGRYAQEEGWKMNERPLRVSEGVEKKNCTATLRLDEWEGWRVGDRCQWENDGRTNEATLRWIGRLRGHNSVYAGLEFDDPVGQGTGMYQGSELFNTPANHAGFVMITTISPLLISTSSHSHPSTYQTQSRDRHKENGGRKEGPSSAFHHIQYPVVDRVGNASPPIDVPISGQGAMIPPPRYKELDATPSTSGISTASSARHRPLPQPPPYDADRPVPMRPSPPSIPPRPAMLPEDYMIESFDVGSCVDVCYKGIVRSGVVRWKGDAVNDEEGRLETSAVVELETSEAPPDGWKQSMHANIPGVDHTLSTVIVPLYALRRDRRFGKESSPMMGNGSSMNGYGGEGMRGQDFGSIDSGVETAKRDPWGGTEELIGRMKGIQGNRNSCYLDSMLYTLFVQCTAFDDILTRRRSEGDIKEYDELVRILSTEIVWPLRRFHYVRADHVMKLRKELEKAMPSIKGLTSEEKDPEEILSSLLRDVFKTKPFLNLINSKSGKVESTWLYHVVVEAGEWQGNIASSQHLLERSLRKDLTKLAECPQVFIMQLPRYGVTKLFDKIVPLEKIDLTPFINNTVFPCAQCQKNPAELYCPECYLTKEALYGEVSYCVECFRSVHMREGLGDHADRPIPPPSRPTKKMTRFTFTLSGVLAIETSHYVSFVRSSHGRWLFFDSMADREGLQNGFNIPQVKECERVSSWLSLAGYQRLRSSPSSLPLDDPLVNRLLSDSYICIYTADQPAITSSSSTSLLSKITKELKISRN